MQVDGLRSSMIRVIVVDSDDSAGGLDSYELILYYFQAS